MSTVQYLLLYKGYSSQGGYDSKVRGFAKLEAARCAMEKSYGKLAASMDIPSSAQTPSNRYTVRTKNSIQLERYGARFQWEIIKAVPEDGPDGTDESNQWHGLREYTVAIEEHIVKEFSVKAYDIFHALYSAKKQYEQGSLAMKSSRPNAHLMMARDTVTGETTEWKEF
ncbi:hypothetical protein [uncultured Oscillibacter sp.]|uniref:hypothetical protein n=1 Tax=uncultured Oscillibacter sp. TaxID=876091 RepID=UPI002632D8C8|nr:hypothetical protein [uncultured Oscillibacter sp.]